MSIEALGLPADADQRAVKQAYARQLKAMLPPDEDPAAFQRLHGLYKAALAEVAFRERKATENGAAPTQCPEAASRPAEKVDAPQLKSGKPSPPTDDLAASTAYDTYNHVVIDGNLLFRQMTEAGAALDEQSFCRWLAQVTADWPIAAKPKVAPHVLRYLVEDVPVIDPRNLAAVVETFALDDVLAASDPVALEQARKKIGALWSDHCVVEGAKRLLRPENRGILLAEMKARAGLPRSVTRRIVDMLTGPNPTRPTMVARFVPFVAAAVMRFLYALSHDRLDLLPAEINRTAVERWKRVANFRHEIRPLTFCLTVFAVLACLAAAAAFVPPMRMLK